MKRSVGQRAKTTVADALASFFAVYNDGMGVEIDAGRP